MTGVADRVVSASPELAREAQQIVEDLSRLSPESRELLLGRLRANLARGDAYRKFQMLYPDRWPLRRQLCRKYGLLRRRRHAHGTRNSGRQQVRQVDLRRL
jgi:hypothetical protein